MYSNVSLLALPVRQREHSIVHILISILCTFLNEALLYGKSIAFLLVVPEK